MNLLGGYTQRNRLSTIALPQKKADKKYTLLTSAKKFFLHPFALPQSKSCVIHHTNHERTMKSSSSVMFNSIHRHTAHITGALRVDSHGWIPSPDGHHQTARHHHRQDATSGLRVSHLCTLGPGLLLVV